MHKIGVMDLGGQYCHLIARRIRDLGVYSEILPEDASAREIKSYKGLILSGGPGSVYDKNSPQINADILEAGIPVLGLCYGHQLIAQHLGGIVRPAKEREYGKTQLEILDKSSIFEGLDDTETVWMSHGDHVEAIPANAKTLGSTSNSPNAAFEVPDKTIFGLQFHVEVTHTVHGMAILDNFLKICEARRDWKIDRFAEIKKSKVLKEVGDKKVFLLVSGGVDSTVCFALLNEALGKDRVIGLHIDHGLERLDEAKQVQAALSGLGFDNLKVYDASKEFLEALAEVYDPEEKRKIIGETFVRVQQKFFSELELDESAWLLGQGTIYPDTIETGGTKNAAIIKTHHNRVELIQNLIEQGKVIEPIKELYKDEVRELGIALGLPRDVVGRHPFPGPGLGVRIICSDKEVPTSQEANAKAKELCKEFNYESKILPIRSVGVQGDFRTYRQPVLVKGALDWAQLDKLSTKLTNKLEEVNRVVFSLTDLDVTKLRFKPGYLSKERINLMQIADDIVTKTLKNEGIYNKIWQFPVILLPLGISGGESIVLRPVESREAMTASFFEISPRILESLCTKLCSITGIDAVFFDITHKPPGTIEWE